MPPQTISAKTFSALLKYATPATRITAVIPMETKSSPQSMARLDTSEYRNASMTPLNGLRVTSHWYFSGTMLIGYIMGVPNNNSWIAKGIAYLISRYLTLSAATNNPRLTDSRTSRITRNGHTRRLKPG